MLAVLQHLENLRSAELWRDGSRGSRQASPVDLSSRCPQVKREAALFHRRSFLGCDRNEEFVVAKARQKNALVVAATRGMPKARSFGDWIQAEDGGEGDEGVLVGRGAGASQHRPQNGWGSCAWEAVTLRRTNCIRGDHAAPSTA